MQSAQPSPQLPLRPYSRRWRDVTARAAGLMRCVLVLLSVAQIMGITHALSDLLEDSDGEQHCAERCPDENNESADFDCPPFCPTCDCAHAIRPLLPLVHVADVLVRIDLPVVLDMPALSWHYQNPPPSSIFRPPRS